MKYPVRSWSDSEKRVFAENKVHVVSDSGWDIGWELIGRDKTSCSVETDVFGFRVVWEYLRPDD
jgi:hypothetical protein